MCVYYAETLRRRKPNRTQIENRRQSLNGSGGHRYSELPHAFERTGEVGTEWWDVIDQFVALGRSGSQTSPSRDWRPRSGRLDEVMVLWIVDTTTVRPLMPDNTTKTVDSDWPMVSS